MSDTKIGRPTDARKDIIIKARIDEETNDLLFFCAENMKISKSDVIRTGILKIYEEIKGESK